MMDFEIEAGQAGSQKTGMRKVAQISAEEYRRDEDRDYVSKRSNHEKSISKRAHERKMARVQEGKAIADEHEEAIMMEEEAWER